MVYLKISPTFFHPLPDSKASSHILDICYLQHCSSSTKLGFQCSHIKLPYNQWLWTTLIYLITLWVRSYDLVAPLLRASQGWNQCQSHLRLNEFSMNSMAAGRIQLFAMKKSNPILFWLDANQGTISATWWRYMCESLPYAHLLPQHGCLFP